MKNLKDDIASMQVEDIQYHKLTELRERTTVISVRIKLYAVMFNMVDRQVLHPTFVEGFERGRKL